MRSNTSQFDDNHPHSHNFLVINHNLELDPLCLLNCHLDNFEE